MMDFNQSQFTLPNSTNMPKYLAFTLVSLFLILFLSCENPENESAALQGSDSSIIDTIPINLLTDFNPTYDDGDVNAVIEIPSGTLEKWELDKTTGQLEWQLINGAPRIVNYLGYPGNYGMIPRTLLSKEQGGDGDPLDIIVLGPPIERGQVVKCKIIGVLYLLDRGEQDDKLMAVSVDSPLYDINNIEELNEKYPGVSSILELWFTNYKGPGIMVSKGFGDKNNAHEILEAAIQEFASTEQATKQ